MKWKIDQFDSFADRVRRSSREILIAALLTIAACAFLLAALLGSNVVPAANLGSVASDETVIN